MNADIHLEHRASSSQGKHEGEPSLGLCDRLNRTRDNSQRQLPTDHDYAVSTREYQTDQSSLKTALTAARSVFGKGQKQRQRPREPHRFGGVDTVTPYQANALVEARFRASEFRLVRQLESICNTTVGRQIAPQNARHLSLKVTSKGQSVGYIRVSTLDQREDRQLEGVELDRRFTDHTSGKDINRPQLTALLSFVREGDTVVCHSMDRLGRNLDDLRKLVFSLTERGIKVHFFKENLVFTGEDLPMANLLLSVMGAIAEFERQLIRERQREGIALAKKRGVYKGRPAGLGTDAIASLVKRLDSGERPLRCCKRNGCFAYDIAPLPRQGWCSVRPRQIVMHCPCGNAKVLAKGLCATCYTLKRQDESYFGGHREEVLKRDGYRCRVPECTTIKRGKRSVAVHHRETGNSDPARMLTLCLACHAKVTRTLFVEADWPDLLRVLWREQHPGRHEQSALNFATTEPASRKQLPFKEFNGEALRSHDDVAVSK